MEADFCESEQQTTAAGEAEGLRLCDRTDVFAFGLVIWEMLAGDVPHASKLAAGDEAYRAAIGTRPDLPHLPISYERIERIFRCAREPLEELHGPPLSLQPSRCAGTGH